MYTKEGWLPLTNMPSNTEVERIFMYSDLTTISLRPIIDLTFFEVDEAHTSLIRLRVIGKTSTQNDRKRIGFRGVVNSPVPHHPVYGSVGRFRSDTGIFPAVQNDPRGRWELTSLPAHERPDRHPRSRHHRVEAGHGRCHRAGRCFC
jgi:hypothetical protein